MGRGGGSYDLNPWMMICLICMFAVFVARYGRRIEGRRWVGGGPMGDAGGGALWVLLFLWGKVALGGKRRVEDLRLWRCGGCGWLECSRMTYGIYFCGDTTLRSTQFVDYLY